MQILVVRFPSATALLESYVDSFPCGGLFYPTRKQIAVGEPVVVDIRVPEVRDYLLIRGTIAWQRRGRRSLGLRAGLAVAFLVQEKAKADYLLSVARGDHRPARQRRHRRLPADLRVDWRIPKQRCRHVSSVANIGTGGAFLRTAESLPQGTSVLLEVVPPGSTAPQILEGRVAWSRVTPGAEGLGVEFRCRDIGGMRRLRELVRRIELASPEQLG